MPLEGHWQRTNTPLRRLTARERNVVLAGLAVTVVAVLALILASGPGSTRHLVVPPGCINVMVAGRTGGEVIHPCGAEARATCAHAAAFDDPRAEKMVAACREAGIAMGPAAARAPGQG